MHVYVALATVSVLLLYTLDRLNMCFLFSVQALKYLNGCGIVLLYRSWTVWLWLTIFSFRYLNAIQTNAPHLLRYLATAFIVNKRRRPQFKEFIKVIQQEHQSVDDPITQFLACIYVNYDFDGAQKKMKECEEVTFHFRLVLPDCWK